MKRYAIYKKSGLDWIELIPSHWEVKWLKHNFKFEKGKNAQLYTKEYIADHKGEYPVYSGQTGDGGVLGRINTFVYDTNDVIMVTTVGAKAMTTKLIAGKYSLSQNCALIKFKNDDLHIRYFNHQFLQIFSYEKGRISLIMQPSLRFEDLVQYKIIYPPPKEQQIITKYLDHKTHLIDTLIEKKQKQIELLQEQRASIINQAVTKGLDSNVKTKDSGIEWLGDIPEGWAIRRFKTLFEIKKRIAYTLGYDVLSITQKGIKIKDIESGEGQLATNYSKYQLVQKGDFAMNQMDLLTGFVDISKFDGVTSPDYRVFVLSDTECFPKYLLYYLQMGYTNKLFFPFGHGAAHLGRWRLPTTAFYNFLAPCPPKKEQIQIAEYISAKTNQIDSLVKKNSNMILSLKEYRTTLISEVITGKIDVRDEVIP